MKGYSVKEEKFCLKLIETGNQTEAYKFAYNVRPQTSDQMVHQMACRLAKKGKITARLDELRELNLKVHIVTTGKLTNMYLMAFHQAISLENPTAAVAATTGLGKLHGLIIERANVDNTGTLTVKHEGLSRTIDILREFKGIRSGELLAESVSD